MVSVRRLVESEPLLLYIQYLDDDNYDDEVMSVCNETGGRNTCLMEERECAVEARECVEQVTLGVRQYRRLPSSGGGYMLRGFADHNLS